jgi:peptidoglycan hydrolase-like protein with peptidoglycan-binding domain
MESHLSGQRRTKRLIALLGAVLFTLLAPTVPSAVAAEATQAATASLDPAGGWHGRAIERPSSTPPSTTITAAARRAAVLRAGAGLNSASGSVAVRRVQRLLHDLGYATGPIDGRFGPRTRSAVGWFQRKHGLAVNGVVGAATLSHLQRRVRGGEPQAEGPAATRPARQQPKTTPKAQRKPQTGAQPQPTPQTRQPTATQPPATTEPRPSGNTASPDDTWLVAALAVLAILGALVLAVLLRRRRREQPAEGTVISLSEPPWVVGQSADPAIGPFSGMATALHVSPPMTGGGGAAAVRYCVIDDRRKVPFWVGANEITESRKPNGMQHDIAEELPYADISTAAAAGRLPRAPSGRQRRRGTRGLRRPRQEPIGERIGWLRSLGMSPDSIADLLNDQRVAPPEGASAWSADSVGDAANDPHGARPSTGVRRG